MWYSHIMNFICTSPLTPIGDLSTVHAKWCVGLILMPAVKNIFLIGIHSMQGLRYTTRDGTTRKSTKRLKHTGNLLRKNLQLKVVLIPDLKPLRS